MANRIKECLALYEKAHALYKKTTDQSQSTKMEEKLLSEQLIVMNAQRNFEILNTLIAFVIFLSEEYYADVRAKMGTEVSIDKIVAGIRTPQNLEEVTLLFAKYPKIIDVLKEPLYEIIELENFAGLLILKKWDIRFIYNIIDSTETADELNIFADDVQRFGIVMKVLMKQLIKRYTELKQVEQKS
jgi:hypothetical protein